ncbi:DCHS1_2 [Acanthosepion pharaonis]|uniref:DCHS1_2 n=1 Tax=Acanthosepion pharaonis TaxID=158019 RepID=A0A812DTB2_ACAPH|nr:DCHS1_2 [Sepia pharaonis]
MVLFYKVSASDPDCGFDSKVTYTIADGMGYKKPTEFYIERNSGRICVAKQLDYEKKSVFEFPIRADDRDGFYMTAIVKVSLEDVNDNPPEFYPLEYSTNLDKDTLPRVPIITVQATDKDSTKSYGTIGYSFLSGNEAGYFRIHLRSGVISLSKLLPNAPRLFQLQVTARDGGGLYAVKPANVTISVSDRNVPIPTFSESKYSFSVSEIDKPDTMVGRVRATIANSAHAITYSIISGDRQNLFQINTLTGVITVDNPLDHDTVPSVLLNIQAASGSPAVYGTSQVNITITDVNDNAPQFLGSNLSISVREDKTTISPFYSVVAKDLDTDVRVRVLDDNDNDPIFSRKRYTFNTLENQSVGTVVGIVSATDRDSGQNAKLNYSIRSHSSEFAINPFLGEVTLRRVLDHETKTHYSIIVEVSDQGQPPRKASAMVDINVLDVNDNAPRFTSKKNAVVLENKAKGTPVLQVVATDPDAKENGSITYFFDADGDQNAIANFAIHPRNGQITTREVLDYESQNKYILTVVARDSGAVPMESRQQVEIRVIDDKDEQPLFPSKNISFSIPENVPIRTSVGQIDAQYGDTESGRYNYYLVGGNIFGAFTIDVSSGEIYTVKDVDFEEASSHPLGVKIVYNGPYSVMSSNITVIINVIDINDNAPMFDTDPVELSVQENTPVGTSLYTFAATDFDSGPNGSIVYSIRSSGSPGSEMFSIDARTGQLTVNKTVDYEKIQATSFIVVAEDQSPDLNSRLSSSITVLVTIEDENDNKPKINNSMLINVSEDESIGFPLVQLIAVDADSGNSSNGIVTYSIVSGNSKSIFLLDENTGLLTLAQKLDRETQDKYALNISSQDQGIPQHVSYTLLTIQVIDVNDNTPKFERSLYHAEIAENTRKNTNIVRIVAQDEDTGANGRIRYLIPQGTADNMFSIDEDSGVIKTTAKLDREYKMTYQITAYAVDDGYPMRYDTTNVVITVKDINDHSPVFKSSVYHLKIPENQRYNVIRTFVAYDADENENGKVTYRIEAGNTDQKFAIDPDTGKLSCEPLDREKVPFYNLTLVAEDAGNPQRTGRTHVMVTVLDLNDNQPVFEQSNYSRMLPEDIPPGTFVLQVSATDADQGANKNISYSLGNNTFGLFTLNSTNGTISTIGYFDREVRSTYQFDVIATDGSLYESPHSVSVPVQIVMDDVNDNRPVFPAQPYRVTISSHLGSDKFVLKVEATDRDAGRNQQVSYSFGSRSDDLAQRLFRINSRTGIIKTKVQMTFDESGYYFLEVIARDNGGPLLSSAGVVEIMVGHHKHQQNLLFNASVYEVSVPENAPKGRHVQTVTALYENRKLTSTRYEFISGNEDKTFFIDAQSGDIIINRPENLNYEKASTLRLMVMAQVSGSRAYTTVNVNLIDVNDHTPIFTQSQYVSFVWENENRDTYVTKVSASDYDANNQVRYSIINGNDGRAFKVEQYSGIIKTTNLYLDREIYSSYQLDIEAADNGSPPKSSTCVLHITVVDKNDNNPVLPTPLPVNIGEGTEVGSVIAMVTANVADLNPSFSYNISSAEDMFNIDHLTGEVTLAQPLDYENRKQYFPNITVKSGNNYATTRLTVNVLDENDNAPEFNKQSYQVTVKETAYIGKSIITVTATDLDSGKNAEITYRMDIPVPEFYIDSRSGTIHVNRSLKFNPNHSIIQLVVVAEDAGNPRLSAVVVVYVQIIAVNTYPPRFLNTSYRVRFDENTVRGTELLDLIGPTDSNSLKKRKVDYKIKEENMRDIFSLGRRSGVIRLNSMLDREKTDRYSFTVVASDDGTPQKTSTAHVEIIVEDVNDQPPVFNQHTYIAMLNESFLSNVTLITVHATDGDKGANSEIEYHITTGNENGLFTIDRTSGNIVITPGKHLDYEKASSHKLVVEAIDCINCQWSQRLSAFCIVIVNVTDINETPPLFPLQRYIEFVAENQPVNTRVFQAHANDKDGTLFGKVVYQIYDGDYKSFHIDRETGLVRTATRFDYEKRSQYTFQLKAMDSGGLHSVIPVEVNILSMDEYTPKFLKSKYSFSIRGDADTGEYVGEVEATDKDQGEDGRIIYRLGGTDDRFMISPLNGSIYVRENLRGGGSEASLRKRREVSTDNQDQKESPKEKKEEKYEDVKLVVIAGSGKSDSKINETHAIIKIDRGCVGCDKLAIVDPGSGGKTLVIIIVVIVLSLILIIACILLFFVYRRRYRKRKPRSVPPSFEVPPSAAPRRPGPPSYREVVRCNGNHIAPSEVLSDRSGNSASSGRGSVEEDEDEEIRMINSNTCLQAQTLSRKVKMPDSGIQQDEDSCSDPPIQNHQEYFAKLGIDTSRIQAKTKPIATAPPLESLHHFPDDGGGDPEEIDINNIVYEKLGDIETDDELSMIENCRDQGFHDAEPHQVASLSSVVNSEEEYSGSYNWDYLLDWGPQYMPLADVFAEIAQLKDDDTLNCMPKKQPIHTVPQRFVNSTLNSNIRTVPPPIITDAPPKTYNQGSNHSSHTAANGPSGNPGSRTNNASLPTLPRSPISHESCFPSPALTPSFTPSLSPLATRSPSISPVVSSRGAGSSAHNTPGRARTSVKRGHPSYIGSPESEQEIRI